MTGNATVTDVWSALEAEPTEAANLRARAAVLRAVQERVSSWGLTQTEAARRLGVSQPRLSDLARGRIDRFSLDALMNIAAAAGLDVVVDVRPAA